VLEWITATDHKRIGVLYLLTSTAFFMLGGVEALLIRIQLAVPRYTFLDPGHYDAIFTMHGTTMIFLVVMPMLLGFANYIVPLQIGAHDMAFPKLFQKARLINAALIAKIHTLEWSPAIIAHPTTVYAHNAVRRMPPATNGRA
jgi:heme/copper-type cytochrome/quinol oxidase subunit 1